MGWGSWVWEGCNRLRKKAGSWPSFPCKDQWNSHISYGKPVDCGTPLVLESKYNVQVGEQTNIYVTHQEGHQLLSSSRREICLYLTFYCVLSP